MRDIETKFMVVQLIIHAIDNLFMWNDIYLFIW